MYDCEGVLESFTGGWWAIKGGDTEDRLGGLRLEQARRILVLECAVVQASKPARACCIDQFRATSSETLAA